MVEPVVREIQEDSQLRLPLSILPRDDITNPTFEDLSQLAILRINDIVKSINPENYDPPPKVFPLAENTRATFFTDADWDEFGNLETEYSRLTYTLSRHPERRVPSVCTDTLMSLLEGTSVLEGWTDAVSLLKVQVDCTVRDVVLAMQASQDVVLAMKTFSKRSNLQRLKSHFIAVPTSYKTCEQVPDISILLWKKSLSDIASQFVMRKVTCARQFLEIHSFLKDPFGGLKKSFDRQLSIFEYLMDNFRTTNRQSVVTSIQWQKVIAQTAQESSYLAVLELAPVALVHFHAHQQLPYIYVDLDELPRAEFSEPNHVVDMIEEILNDDLGFESCRIPPIAIAFYPALGVNKESLKIIIDGNHRTTAIMVLRFLSTQLNGPKFTGRPTALMEFCKEHRLGNKWLIDLMDVMAELDGAGGRACRQLLKAKMEVVAKFHGVSSIPAVVVQEENFHTICNQRSSPSNRILLQPVHQALFNTESLGFTFPRAAQAHGRPLGFKPMPLI